MIDDFYVFDESSRNGRTNATGNHVDPDIALITAYLARELTLVQITGVEKRLARDPEFRAAVQPVIDAWSLPDTLCRSDSNGFPSSASRRLTREQIESGWNRHILAVSQSTVDSRQSAVHIGRSTGVRRQPTDDRGLTSRSTRRQGALRAAATLLAITAPVAIAAQLVIYAAAHVDAPGHSFARSLVPPSWRAPQQGIARQPYTDPDLAVSGDSPVQIALTPAPDQQNIPLLELSPATGRTAQKFVAILGLHETPDGRVIVNDTRKHQIWMFDKSLASGSIVVDSARGSARSYPEGNVGMPLVPYLGDSVLFVDHAFHQLQLLGATGEPQRSIALVSRQDIYGFFNRGAGVDHRGNLVYSGPREGTFSTPGIRRQQVVVPFSASLLPRSCIRPVPNTCNANNPPPPRVPGANSAGRSGNAGPPPNGIEVSPINADSIPIQRADFEARRVDTVGFLRDPVDFDDVDTYGGGKLVIIYGKDSVATGVKQMINPLYHVDEFAVLSDGTIALVRGSDYHVDWIHPDGSKSSSGKLPFDWKRLSDVDKQKLSDSTMADVNAFEAWAIRRENRMPAPGDSIPVVDSILNAGGRGNCGSVGLAVVQCPTLRHRWPYEVVPLSEIADYYPPFKRGATIADRDGNLWILPRTTTQSKAGELVYDVVHPRKGLVQRVRLPVGRSIAGFGKGGVVYLQSGDVRSGFVLEKTVIQVR